MGGRDIFLVRTINDGHAAGFHGISYLNAALNPTVLMLPDSTFFQTLLDPAQWTLTGVLTLIVALIGLPAAVVGFLSWWQQRRKEKGLDKEFGGELYTREQIANSTRYYVVPDCASIDPGQEAEMRRVVTTRQNLFERVDQYLEQAPSQRHLLILADSGMGKTSFVLNYYAQPAACAASAAAHRHRLARPARRRRAHRRHRGEEQDDALSRCLRRGHPGHPGPSRAIARADAALPGLRAGARHLPQSVFPV